MKCIPQASHNITHIHRNLIEQHPSNATPPKFHKALLRVYSLLKSDENHDFPWHIIPKNKGRTCPGGGCLWRGWGSPKIPLPQHPRGNHRKARWLWSLANFHTSPVTVMHRMKNTNILLKTLYISTPCDSKGCIWHVRGQLGYTRIC